MQFFMFDFALVFAVLLGYRALVAVVRRRAPLMSVAGRAVPNARTNIPRSPDFIQRRRAVRPRAVVRKPDAPMRVPQSELPRANIHRLINFW